MVLVAYKRVVRTKVVRGPVANMLLVAKVGLKILSEMAFTPVPNDKSSVYTLVSDKDMLLTVSEILQCKRYSEFSSGDFDMFSGVFKYL